MNILIAEDDRTSRTLLSAILQKQGHTVVTTTDGDQAWERLQAPQAPRLAILDWMMPKMNGLELCRRIKEQGAAHPPYLILLTSLGDKAHIVEGLDAGADDYMIKPFDPIELRARVDAGERVLALRDGLEAQARALREALDQIKTLKGLVPICMYCKRIRDDQDFWQEVEEYVTTHTDASFSHGLCPECFEKYFSDEDEPTNEPSLER
jgi:phosphoserine phosphatase RsbU/P